MLGPPLPVSELHRECSGGQVCWHRKMRVKKARRPPPTPKGLPLIFLRRRGRRRRSRRRGSWRFFSLFLPLWRQNDALPRERQEQKNSPLTLALHFLLAKQSTLHTNYHCFIQDSLKLHCKKNHTKTYFTFILSCENVDVVIFYALFVVYGTTLLNFVLQFLKGMIVACLVWPFVAPKYSFPLITARLYAQNLMGFLRLSKHLA